MTDRTEILRTLRALPDELDALCRGLSDLEQMRLRPSPDEWSMLEVACHLRDSAEIEGTRVRRLVEEEQPTLEPYDQEALARERDYQGDDPRRVLTAVRAFFGGLAYQLERLPDEEWRRSGFHPEWGTVTVASRAEAEAEHARIHLEQARTVSETMNA